MASLALENEDWDLILDENGNLKTVSAPLQTAQDVSVACRVWKGEGYWDTSFGVPYQNILGERPPLNLISGYLAHTAVTVEGVESASADLSVDKNGKLQGTILINGETNVQL